MHELRLFAILCAALCVVLAAAYRGAPVLPALAGAAVLLAADVVAMRQGWLTLRALPLLAAGGVLAGMAAWWVANRWGRHGARGLVRGRGLVVSVTVLSAFLAPGIYIHRMAPHKQAPPAVLLVAVGLPTVLALLVGLGIGVVAIGLLTVAHRRRARAD